MHQSDETIEIPSPHGTLRLRPEREEDLAFRFGLFCDSRPDLAMLPFDGPVREHLMTFQFRAQTHSYRTQFPGARFDIIELGHDPIGRIIVDRPGNAVHIIDQALLPRFRNLGIGGTIMRALMREAGGASLPVRLHVASNNDAALRLYLRLGFVPAGTSPTHMALEWRPPPDQAPGGPP